MDAIKDKSSKERVNLLSEIIDIVQIKNKQKRDVALEFIMDNFHKIERFVNLEERKSVKDDYSRADKEESSELLNILAKDAEAKDLMLIEHL